MNRTMKITLKNNKAGVGQTCCTRIYLTFYCFLLQTNHKTCQTEPSAVQDLWFAFTLFPTRSALSLWSMSWIFKKNIPPQRYAARCVTLLSATNWWRLSLRGIGCCAYFCNTWMFFLKKSYSMLLVHTLTKTFWLCFFSSKLEISEEIIWYILIKCQNIYLHS